MYTAANHTYAICAYGNSPYLEDCIKSLKAQTVRSTIILATSTPSEAIKSLCVRYEIPLFVNHGIGGIAGDWNFAVSCCKTELVTIAHQDDIYLEGYTKQMLACLNSSENPTLYFTDYGELRGEDCVIQTKLLKIKRALLCPMRAKTLRKSRFMRRRCLSLGNSICCPSATLICSKFKQPIFEANFGSNLDWETWEKLANVKGEFVYNPKVMILHRIHEESETSHIINDGRRTREDYEMLCHFWPKPIAGLINRAYSTGQGSNNL